MEEHERILGLAADGKLPEKVDGTSDIPVSVVSELADAGYLKVIDATSHCGPAYLNPKITMAGREYLEELRRRAASTEVKVDNPIGFEREVEQHRLPSTGAWPQIERTYGVPKKVFGKRIAFVTDPFKRKVIFRDIEQAFLLAESGFNKPAVVLASSVIEELLRYYLAHRKVVPENSTLDGYIRACEKGGLLKGPTFRLADSFRQFRNIVHLENESSPRHTISKATAKGAVASVFTIVNDFH